MRHHPDEIIRVAIADAEQAGRMAAYEAVAIRRDKVHLSMRFADWQQIYYGRSPGSPAPGSVPRPRRRFITPEQQAIVDARAAICRDCDQNDGLKQYSVKCHGCGCAGLSLLNGSCKLGKWPE